MFIPFQDCLFFVLLAGSAFTLRGIWGHNLGGSVLGILVGLGLGMILDLPVLITMELMFWLGLAWALSSFVGWARHGTFQRFARGYVIYGMFPNIIAALILYRGNIVATILLVVIGSLGMGIGFGMSHRLLEWVRKKIEVMYKKKHAQDEPRLVNWGVTPLKEGEVSHVYLTRLDGWKLFLEITSGALFAITSLIVYSIYPVSNFSWGTNPQVEMNEFHVLILIISFVLVPTGLVAGVISRKGERNTFKMNGRQQPWDKKKVTNAHRILALSAACWCIIFLASMQAFLDVITLFLLFYWIVNGIGRFVNPLDSKMFQTDCIIDLSLGILVTILSFTI
ncbi:MAG: hypothetical protein ACTSU9_11540 [Promethearchaeota archaeon]